MKPWLAAALGAALAAATHPALVRAPRAFPPLSELPSTPYQMQDAALASAGMRALAADLAWIQLLQYTAGSLPAVTDAPGKPFEHMKALCLRAARLDPSFHRAYLFGAGTLGWFGIEGVERESEAIEILEEALRRDPGQPLYSEYLAAIAYKKKGDDAKLVSLLESLAYDPSSPIEMKAILANLYKSRGEYARALELWDEMLGNEAERREWPRARIQAAELKTLLRARRSSGTKAQ